MKPMRLTYIDLSSGRIETSTTTIEWRIGLRYWNCFGKRSLMLDNMFVQSWAIPFIAAYSYKPIEVTESMLE